MDWINERAIQRHLRSFTLLRCNHGSIRLSTSMVAFFSFFFFSPLYTRHLAFIVDGESRMTIGQKFQKSTYLISITCNNFNTQAIVYMAIDTHAHDQPVCIYHRR